VQVIRDGQDVLDGTSEPVKFPHREDVTVVRPQIVQGGGQSRTCGATRVDTFSSKIRPQPAAVSASRCNFASWTPVETRAKPTNSVAIALEACTSPPTVPDNLPASIAYTDHAAQAGLIDPTANLARQRTWFFHGTQDTVVAPSVADDLAAYYHHYGVPLTYRNTDPAGHAWISPLGPNPCGVNQLPYINNCGFDAERQMLTTMFGSVHPPNLAAPQGAVQAFSQNPYATAPQPGAGDVTRTGAAAIGMGQTGYVYVPNGCANGQKCRVVVSLHGCLQTADQIGTTFVTDSYLNQYADTNKLVILYPQATPDTTFGNPKGCWDWWGYLGANDGNYATRNGPPVTTVMNMITARGG